MVGLTRCYLPSKTPKVVLFSACLHFDFNQSLCSGVHSFLQKHMEKRDKKGPAIYQIYCQKDILYSADGYFKMFDLTGKYSTVGHSISSFQKFVEKLKESFETTYKVTLAYEAVDFSNDKSFYNSISRHPAVLPIGAKVQFILKLNKCVKEGKIKLVADIDSQFQSWNTKFLSYINLKAVASYINLKAVASYDNAHTLPYDSPVRLLRLLRNMSEHINKNVDKKELRTRLFSPLGYHETTKFYSEKDMKDIIDFLYPTLLSRLHKQAASYSAFDVCKG